MRKRIFAILLAICMLIGLLPMQASAIADKGEITVAVTGKTTVGEILKADLSELPDDSKAVIQWQKKDVDAKDSKAKDVGDGEKALELEEKDVGKVFRIVVKESEDSKKSYTSEWTKKVKAAEKGEVKQSETKEPETEAPETKQTEAKEPETKQTEAKEPETKAPETKQTEAKEPETKASETKQTEAKEPETKAPETKQTEAKEPETKAPETKQTEAKEPETEAPVIKQAQTAEPRTGESGTPDETASTAPVLRIDKAAVEFASVTEGYTSVPEAQTVTITNDGTATVNLTQPAAKDFTIGNLSVTALEAGKTATFTIQPKSGLAKATYQEIITVTGDNGEKLEITVKFAVDAAPVYIYTISVNQASLNFGSAVLGYKAPAAQTVEITNTGNANVKLIQPAAVNFEIGTLSPAELAPGAKASFTIRPKTGLDSGSYEDTIEVKTEQGTTQTVKAAFTVTGTKLLSIVKPEKVVKTNGKDKNAKALGLPAKVSIKTSDGTKKAQVTWRVKAANYSKYIVEKQTFKVTGKVTLPKGVYNPDKISLTTTINVTVKAYVPKIPDASSNKINSIEAGKTYTADTDIAFQAVGGGMDNKNPKKGDVRYYPASWAVSGTNNFNTDDFSGTFKLTSSGDYTLKVTYNRQTYDGAAWVNSGTTDTKSVSFKIAANTPTTTVTGKVAAKTGDDSPILPLVVVCAVCVLCIGGIILSKKKKG